MRMAGQNYNQQNTAVAPGFLGTGTVPALHHVWRTALLAPLPTHVLGAQNKVQALHSVRTAKWLSTCSHIHAHHRPCRLCRTHR